MSYRAASRTFFTGFKETLAGHSLGVGGIVAGLVVAWQLGVFRSVPWAVAVYPAVLTVKAVINGIFNGRLNTDLQVGTISPKFSGNLKMLGRMFQRILALTLVTSVAISIASTVIVSLFLEVGLASFWDVLAVVVATMGLGLATYLLTLPVTFTAFKKGLDLDGVAYPIAATVADIVITICYALMVVLFYEFGTAGRYAVVLMAVLAATLALYSLIHIVLGEGFSRTVKTSVYSLLIVAVIASVTGAILQRIDVITSLSSWNPALAPAALFTVYPAMIELVADAALVIGSTATTRLVLGLLQPYLLAMRNHAPQIFGAWAASFIAFVPLSAASMLLTGTFGLPGFYLLVSVLLVTNAFAMIAMTLISYALAILTFKKGLDPDHLVVPIESSLAGTITSIALLAALFLLLHLRG